MTIYWHRICRLKMAILLLLVSVFMENVDLLMEQISAGDVKKEKVLLLSFKIYIYYLWY